MLIETTDDKGSDAGEDFSLVPSECPKESPNYQDTTPCKQEEVECIYDHEDKECGQVNFKCHLKMILFQDGKLIWKIKNRGELEKLELDCL